MQYISCSTRPVNSSGYVGFSHSKSDYYDSLKKTTRPVHGGRSLYPSRVVGVSFGMVKIGHIRALFGISTSFRLECP